MTMALGADIDTVIYENLFLTFMIIFLKGKKIT